MALASNPLNSVTAEILQSQIIGGDAIFGEKIILPDETASSLFVSQTILALKAKVKYALVMVVSNSSDEQVAAFLEYPTTNAIASLEAAGMPLGNHAVLEVKGKTNLENFRIHKLDANSATSIFVHYYI